VSIRPPGPPAPHGGVTSIANGGKIPHGLPVAPSFYSVSATVASHLVAVTAVDATDLTVALRDLAGLPVSIAEPVAWMAGR
jgi:hypothetical protein